VCVCGGVGVGGGRQGRMQAAGVIRAEAEGACCCIAHAASTHRLPTPPAHARLARAPDTGRSSTTCCVCC
jgi:hypothetical protein